jgi:hypothetical protein
VDRDAALSRLLELEAAVAAAVEERRKGNAHAFTSLWSAGVGGGGGVALQTQTYHDWLSIT